MGKDGDLEFFLDGHVLDDLPNLKRVFIYILLTPQRQRTVALQHIHLRHLALAKAYLQLTHQLHVNRHPVEPRRADQQHSLLRLDGTAVAGPILAET
jgi:hypothetical protein